MALRLTTENVAAAWDYMVLTAPFDSWNLPDSSEIVIKIVKDKNNFGWLTTKRGRKPCLSISGAVVGSTQKLMEVLAHEGIHLHQYLTGMPLTHGAAFEKMAVLVCQSHGFDHKGF